MKPNLNEERVRENWYAGFAGLREIENRTGARNLSQAKTQIF